MFEYVDDHISTHLVSFVILCNLWHAFKNIILKGGLYVPAQKDCGTRKAKIPEGRVSSSEGGSLPQHPPCMHHPGAKWRLRIPKMLIKGKQGA